MKSVVLNMKCALAFALAGILTPGAAIADKPPWAGGGRGGNDERIDRRDEQRGERSDEQRSGRRNDNRDSRRDSDRDSTRERDLFSDRHRVVVREYYGAQFRGGRCPPGLAKKNNGCMPPGQAKKWQVGRPLPREVTYYQVPQPLVVQLGPPPSGYRYVRVATDILLIAIGTRMVADAIQDIGR